MRTEAELRAAVADLLWSLRRGLIPPECRELISGEVAALRYALGEEEPSDGNLEATLGHLRNWRTAEDGS